MKLSAEFAKEQLFEQVRVSQFAGLPSRQRCMFLIPEGADPLNYLRALGITAGPDTPHTLIRVAPKPGARIHIAPFKLLNVTAQPPEVQAQAAAAYWSAVPSSSPYEDEILLEGEYILEEVLGPLA